jgi:hypothetical protein
MGHRRLLEMTVRMEVMEDGLPPMDKNGEGTSKSRFLLRRGT